MKNWLFFLGYSLLTTTALTAQTSSAQSSTAGAGTTSGNPVFPGWYADPEGIKYSDTYWVFPTYSAAYNDQVFFELISEGKIFLSKKNHR